jgi:DNA-binding response OmpR family regulator
MHKQLNKNIILIEDDQIMLSLLTTLLGLETYHVIALRHPTTDNILEIIENHIPVAIILDVHLEDQNGIDLLNSFQAKAKEFNISVMMTSGEDLRRECLEAGADGFLLKPYMPADLITWLNNRSQASQKKES